MASSTKEGVLLRWIEQPAPGFEDVEAGRSIPFDAAAWAAAEERLQSGAGASYPNLARAGEFGSWWPDRCGGDSPGVRRFRLQLPPSVWERPWEGLVGGLDPPRWDLVSVIRQTEADASPPQPAELSDPLSILWLRGAPSGAGLDTLDLAAEFTAMETAYANLDLAARQAIAAPTAATASLDSLLAMLIEHRPAVLWFSGHGRDGPAGLLLADNHWLTPEELAEKLRDAAARGGRTPLYVILWACQTGSAPRFAARGPAPEFTKALCDVGVAAVLASQAPLSDKAALLATGHIFVALASGRPLDHAVARVRAALMRETRQNLGAAFDWMCPVVWSKGSPPPALSWRDRREQVTQRQAAAHKLVPPALGDALAEDRPADRAVAPWPSATRLWVKTSAPGAQAPRVEWARRLLARLKDTDKTIVWFDLLSGALESQLGVWAEMVMRTIEYDDDHSGMIGTAAGFVQNSRERGWRSLCGGESFIIAILDPPEDAPEWFWDGIREGKAQFIALAGDYPEARSQEGWSVESIEQPQAAPEASKTLAALAVLGCPADPEDIKQAGQSVDPWISTGLVLKTDAGCVMPAGIAETIGRGLSADELRESHRLAHAFLDGDVALRRIVEGREDVLLARWRHAQAAAWPEKVLQNANWLLQLYRAQQRPDAFVGIFEQVISRHRELPDPLRIGVGWAYLTLGDSQKATAWLDEINPDDISLTAEAASWYMVRAEAEKSSGLPGSKERPRAILERALAVLEEDDAENNRYQRLRCRHDLARLTHFFDHNPAAAIPEYEQVAREWNTIAYAKLDRAITLRNLAEALMDVGRLPEAEARAAEARRGMPHGTRHVVYSELEYLAGRIAEKQKQPKGDILRRFRDCREKALLTNHLMMVAIVDSRLFWLEDRGQSDPGSFSDQEWQTVAQKLAIFERHAWAARVLTDGHLRAARRLGGRGERGRARNELAEARRIVDAHPAFAEGSGSRAGLSDRRRIAVLYAGTALYEPAPASGWQQFIERYPEWAPDWQAGFPKQIWELAE